MDYEAITLVVRPPLARLVLRRADSGNEVDSRLLKELADAVAIVGDQSDIRVLLLEAEGVDFCRGWAENSIEAALTGSVPFAAAFEPLARLSLPTIVALHGQVASAGLEMALACDIRLAASDALFSMPEVARGLIPLAGGTQRLPRAIGKGRALAMLLTGEVLDAQEAYRCGLVMKVVSAEVLAEEAAELARRVATRGPTAVKYAKEAINRGLDMTLDQALRYETDLTVILQTTGDRAEGVRAFFEGHRQPNFEGQ